MNNSKNNSSHETNDISVDNNVDVQARLLNELKEFVSKYSDYETPFARSDGDIIIGLKKAVKKKRQTTQSISEAVKFMMNGTKDSIGKK